MTGEGSVDCRAGSRNEKFKSDLGSNDKEVSITSGELL